MTRRSRLVRLTLLLVFVVLPLIEIYLLVQVGQAIGTGWVILLVIAGCVLGVWVIRHEGGRAWRALRDAVDSGRPPGKELADGAVILAAGILLIVPGLITDALGILMLLPPTRPLFRRLLTLLVARRVIVDATRPGPGPSSGPVIRGEVIDDD